MQATTKWEGVRKLFFTMLAVASVNGLLAQSKAAQSDSSLTAAIQQQKYLFEVTMVRPSRGGQRIMNAGYTMRISRDTVYCDLPYFGRLYQAPIGTDETGIKFTSTQFEYKIKDRKKGGWDIMIKPGDSRIANTLQLTVFDNGSATLNVTSNDREPIQYTGIVTQTK